MGWLFAVALGLQERSSGAIFNALVPLTLGHVASVALVVLVALLVAAQFPHAVVHQVAAAILLGFAAYRLIRARHPRWVGMQVGFAGLALWGFLVSTAHGAGLMLLPFVTVVSSGQMPMPRTPSHADYAMGGLMVADHTLGYLVALTTVALVVYTKLGVRFLRTAWLNLDIVWGAALLATGIFTLLT